MIFTNNALVRWPLLRDLGPNPFDEQLALTGGEDSDLFRRFANHGHDLRWAANAVVREWVPESRASMRWLVQRQYRYGNAAAFLDRRQSLRKWAWRLVLAIRNVVVAALWLPFASVRGQGAMTTTLQRLALGSGYLSGSLGHRYEEYR